MPRRNRVTPFGEFEASPARGLFMGNRGILHDENGMLGSARWRHKSWVTCLLSYKGVRRTLMQPGNYTELFFVTKLLRWQEATGHVVNVVPWTISGT
jgi:hypothetical protein